MKYKSRSCASIFFLLTFLFAATIDIRAQQKETIENKVPKHLPIKVEILYGKQAEILENATIQVTNTGKRPIYFLNFQVITADNSGLAMKYGVSSFYFGRLELITFGNLANSDDPAIKSGESVVFEISKKQSEGFRRARRDAFQIVPEKYELIFQFLNFGDDTGFSGTTAKPFSFKEELPVVNATDRKSFFFETAN